MKYHTYKIEKNYKNIYYFLKEKNFSENFISNLRKTWGNLKVNNKTVNIKTPLNTNDELQINSNPNIKTSIMHCIIPLHIVFEDEYYLLIDKPSGLSCMPTQSHFSHNLAGAICYYMQKKDPDFVLRIINRLDKDTAGIIIVAKDSISQNRISNIQKEYHAICNGKIESNSTISSPIKTICTNGINENKRIVSPDGKDATTHITPINANKHYSLISATLEHGRTHQIRLHLSSIGHALLGDSLYGKKSELINHTALICKKVSFFHPFLEKEVKFEIDYPEDFDAMLKILELSK